MQIERHYARNSLEPDMQLDKLQAIATSIASPDSKVQWLMWWNSSEQTRAARKFPSKTTKDILSNWLDKACWYAGVSLYALPLPVAFGNSIFLVLILFTLITAVHGRGYRHL